MSDDGNDLTLDDFDDGHDNEHVSSSSGQARLHAWWALWQYALRYPEKLWAIGACAILTALLEVCFPLVTMAVIDEVAESGLRADLKPLALAYLLLTITLALIISAFVRLCGQLEASVSHDIRQAGFANLQRLSFSYYNHRPVGWLMARMTSDCQRLSDIMAWGFLDLIWSVTAMLCMTVIMLTLQPTLALTVLAVLPLLAWLSVVFEKHLPSSARQVRARNSRVTASYNEGITGVMTSKAFVCEDRLGIGIEGCLATPPLPHHQAYGSVPWRFRSVECSTNIQFRQSSVIKVLTRKRHLHCRRMANSPSAFGTPRGQLRKQLGNPQTV